jgi:hypothetical protein
MVATVVSDEVHFTAVVRSFAAAVGIGAGGGELLGHADQQARVRRITVIDCSRTRAAKAGATDASRKVATAIALTPFARRSLELGWVDHF